MPDRTSDSLPSDGSPRLVLAALFTSVFSFCIALGGLTPLISLVLEGRGVDATVIGLVVAAQPVGTIVAASFVPRVLRRLGTADTILVCGLVEIVVTALLPVFTSVPAWFALRFVMGVAGAGPWIVVETWVNAVASERGRGRMVALYGSILGAGFFAGPLLLTVIGTDGLLPFIAFVLLQVASMLPILLTRGRAPRIAVTPNPRLTNILFAAPALFAAAILAGVVDIAFFSFLPIWGLRNGLEETFAVALLTVFVAGNIVMQYPLGWLADVVGYRPAMVLCGLVCLAGPALAPQLLDKPALLAVTLFIWGGVAWGIYSIALAALGMRFRGSLLAAANAVFVIVYEVSNIVGPPVAGAAVDLWPEQGLMILMGSVAGVFLLVVMSRLGRTQTLKG